MTKTADAIAEAIKNSLNIIEQERERIIISKRFGLSAPKETLEQIGNSLSITRERVRQLEKAILVRLHVGADEGQIAGLPQAEKLIIRHLAESGRVSRLSDLAAKIYERPATDAECAGLVFIADISRSLTVLSENDRYYLSIGIADFGDEKALRGRVDEIVKIISAHKSPLTLDELDEQLAYEHPSQIAAVASLSKQLATLNGVWGLAKWPTVNPKNIRDKVYVVLSSRKEPMHFADIAKAIAESDFRHKDVTVQAIHNELIKDKRFVLIGRGIYALDSWGFKRGTVAEIITDILTKADAPLTREEIVKQVLRSRKVKETTILLNLQNKSLFTKLDKNAYILAARVAEFTPETGNKTTPSLTSTLEADATPEASSAEPESAEAADPLAALSSLDASED